MKEDKKSKIRDITKDGIPEYFSDEAIIKRAVANLNPDEARQMWIQSCQKLLRKEGFGEEITVHVKLTMFFWDCWNKKLSPKESVDLFMLKGKNLPDGK